MKPIIVPAILVKTFEEFSSQIQKLAPFFKLVQIDVMDGEFVDNRSFDDIEKINELPNLPDLELHLMVKHPLVEIAKWKSVKNIKKIIFHIESDDDPSAVCDAIGGICAQAGIALNPETPLSAVLPFLDRVNEVLFLTVNPGRQGNPFLPEVGEKIKELAVVPNHPLIGVDGGINETNIAEVKSWGAEIFCIGSLLTRSDNIPAALKAINSKL
jgi:ribulose-phosphate 3-epimerase